MANTPNRNYPVPDPENWVSDDVSVIITAFNAIDTDVAALVLAVGTKANIVHTHAISDIGGLQTELNNKAPQNHTHSLGSLSDVTLTGVANGMVLAYAGGVWVATSASSIFGAHTHSISDVSGLADALSSKLDAASLGSAATKTTPVDGDTFPLTDSQASNALKRISWVALKTALRSFFDPIYQIPTGTVLDFAGTSAPSGFALCFGQAVSRTSSTYAALFAAIGTTYGNGDGTSTFNLPDLRGRIVAGKDDMGGTSADRLTNQVGGVNGDVLGAVGGSEMHALTSAEIPAHTHPASSGNGGSHAHGAGLKVEAGAGYLVYGSQDGGGAAVSIGGGGASSLVQATTSTDGSHNHTVTVGANTGGNGQHNNVQPTIVMSKIIKL